ncbi:MAG: hypothetical protein WC373_13050, partial [Smithella sp.]
TAQEAKDIQEKAYLRDFHELGPSWFRLIETEYEGWKHLHHSDKHHLRARADFFAHQLKGHKTMLAAMQHLVPTAHMRRLIKDVRLEVEDSFGPANLFQVAAACGLFVTGRIREFRTRHWGDVIQPPTKFIQYDGR